MCTVGPQSRLLLLRTVVRECLESGVDAPDRGAVSQDALLWLAENEAVLRAQGYQVNGKRVRRLMRQMGLRAITVRKHPVTTTPGHRIYPYLLRDRTVEFPNQVWCADITYVPMPLGFLYLVAIMDRFSRYVVAWALSNSLEGSFCRTALQQALERATPLIFNTDQGSQFTAQAFTRILEAAGVPISIDGRGRLFDNIFVKRLWRSVKDEHLYLYDHQTVAAVRQAWTAISGSTTPPDRTKASGIAPPAEVHYA